MDSTHLVDSIKKTSYSISEQNTVFVDRNDALSKTAFYNQYFSLLGELQVLMSKLEISTAERQLTPSEYIVFRAIHSRLDDILTCQIVPSLESN